MNLNIHGKQMDIGDALRGHITDKLEEVNEKYFNRAIEANVTLTPDGGSTIKTHVSVRIGKDIMVMSDASEHDAYASFDSACDKVAKQMRRYKKRIRDHHERLENLPEDNFMPARDVVISAQEDKSIEEQEEQDHADPLVVAEMTTNIQTMSVSEAVMRLDLSGENALLFRNAHHNGLNMVHKRKDGNIGWIDPEGNQGSESLKVVSG